VRRHDRADPSRDPDWSSELGDQARRNGVNPKTIAKWPKRTSVADLLTGPIEPRSSTLSPEQEAVVAFCHTLLPLDDCL
jgi:hypothetical protein